MAACEKFREQFDLYFDNELKEPRRKRLLAHLEACTACRVDFKLYHKVITSVESLEDVAPPADLTESVMRAVASGGSRVDALPDPPLPMMPPQAHPGWALAFGAVLLTAMVFFIMPPAPSSTQESRGLLVPARGPDAEPGLDAGVIPEDLTQFNSAGRTLTGVQLVKHNGSVQLMALGQTDWQEINGQVPLAYGDRVRTGDDGVAGVEYQKENVALRLKPNSIIQLVSPSVFRVFAGNTWVKVSKKGTVFSAETPNAIASVRGTKFSVEVLPITDAYKDQGTKTLMRWIEPGLSPRTTTDPSLYATQMGLSLMAAAAGLDIWPNIQTQVKVYESRVNVVAKDRDGHDVASHDVDAGFKTSVQLAMVPADQPLSEDDFTDWRSVMVFDPLLLERARARVAASGATAASAVSQPLPPAGAATGVEPVSVSGPRPAGMFEDIHKHGR